MAHQQYRRVFGIRAVQLFVTKLGAVKHRRRLRRTGVERGLIDADPAHI